ncbi:MAG TPA: HAD family phosphatase, partial [Verrucomicrobiota bacterium]|nr:HAD family phosphatase [Verrucomicrobiota bacterium]
DLFFPDVVPLIEKLSKRYPLGLASGSEKKVIEAVLALKNMRRFFKAVVSSGDVYKGKPAPDIFILTARLIGVNPSECYVIEDSKPGIKAGLAAGMKVIAITNTYPASELKEANYVVSNYKELEKLLL